MSLDESFWKGRRVFVTGHTGFKGSWLSLWLRQLGAEVTGYALAPPSEPSLFELARVAEGMRSLEGDVRDLESLRAALAAARPEVVLHLAAQSLVRAGYRDPVETYATNVMGTVHLLAALREVRGVRSVVVVTSDKCYDDRRASLPYGEDDPLGGADPYASSKACAELVTAAMRRAYFAGDAGVAGGPAIASARAGNVIGGGDWAEDRLVPDIVRGVLSGEEVLIRSPGAVRPWQHVLEPLYGYLLLAERLAAGDGTGTAYAEAWNFGPDAGDVRTVGWLVERLAEHWGARFRWRLDDTAGPHEALLLDLDAGKAHDRLGWRPVLPLAPALEWLVDWHRAHADGEDVRAVTGDQIRRYRAALAR